MNHFLPFFLLQLEQLLVVYTMASELRNSNNYNSNLDEIKEGNYDETKTNLDYVNNVIKDRMVAQQMLLKMNFNPKYVDKALTFHEVMAEMFEISDNIYDLQAVVEIIKRLINREDNNDDNNYDLIIHNTQNNKYKHKNRNKKKKQHRINNNNIN